jgi:predicted metal-dependent hydrolase
VAIVVGRDGRVVVRAPLRMPEAAIHAFVQAKAGWIREKQADARQRPVAPAASYGEGDPFLFLGQSYPLVHADRQAGPLVLADSFSIRRRDLPRAGKVFTDWYREQARKVLAERAAFFASKYSFVYQSIRITSARTRWGSCSPGGRLAFSWRLVMAPLEVVDYVVVHELVHLKVPNHSKIFWAGVESILPDFRKRRVWLRVNGHSLTLGD